jgi:hypothetical protein
MCGATARAWRRHPASASASLQLRNALLCLFVSLQAQLPPPSTVLPREKPVPKAPEATRWELFAKEKGIKKRKRERMVFDEEKKEWAPRWGYKVPNPRLASPSVADVPSRQRCTLQRCCMHVPRLVLVEPCSRLNFLLALVVPDHLFCLMHVSAASLAVMQRANDETKVWAVPVKGGTDKMEDPFLEMAMQKKQRVVKNKLNQLKNLVRPSSGSRCSHCYLLAASPLCPHDHDEL